MCKLQGPRRMLALPTLKSGPGIGFGPVGGGPGLDDQHHYLHGPRRTNIIFKSFLQAKQC